MIFRRLLIAIFILLAISSCKEKTKKEDSAAIKQPLLGYRAVGLIEIDGFEVKDLNQNGQLDIYEDWRLSHEERSKDLVSKMTLEQKAGFMLISSTRLENDWSFGKPENQELVTSGFNEIDAVMPINIFTRKPLPYPMMGAAGTTKDVTQFHKRHFILRANTSPKIIAEWANNLQELCEGDGLGIPGIIASNPRNHIATDAAIGLSVGKTPFTSFPMTIAIFCPFLGLNSSSITAFSACSILAT